jgi:hypothetical protein
MATETTPGAFYRSWRLMAIDGTNLDVPDTAENDEEFGRPTPSRGEGSAFPQVRLVGLGECGTHAITAVAIGGYETGENTLATELVGKLSPGMLLLADRGFGGSYTLFSAMASSGADLLWRVKSTAVLPVLERFSDGSYRSELVIKDEKRRKQQVVAIRVIAYEIDDEGRPQAEETTYRLITTILEPDSAPASELSGLNPERWEFETLLDELKTHERGPRVVLRSKSPDGVRQEIYGYLCTHYAIRALMCEVESPDGIDPDRVSFTRSLRASTANCPCRDRHDRPRVSRGTTRSCWRDHSRASPREATASRSTGRETQDEQVRCQTVRSSQLASSDQACRGGHPGTGGTLTKRYWT